MLKKVMVVDDDNGMRDNLQDILEDEGYSFCSASTCVEALKIAEKEMPQVALLDLKLPDDSGLNLMAALKSLNPECICVMVTAYANLDTAVAALEKGAFQYLQKPVRTVEMLRLLERIFEMVQIRAEKRQAEDKLKESEERFRTIFETARDMIFLKDRELKYTLVNPSIQTLYEKEITDFLGKTDETIFGDKESEARNWEENAVLNGNTMEMEEIRTISGTRRTFHTVMVPMSGSTGEITGICGISRDITATKHLEAQLIQAQKMEAIGTLAGGISHDFNNLLQAILGYTQMMMMDKPDDHPDMSKLEEIEGATKRASDLIQQLLTFSRKVESKLRPVDLNTQVQQVSKLLNRTIPKMIEIRLQLADEVSAINADPGQLEQVMLNIGVNARDAMPDGGKLIISSANVHLDEAFCRNHFELSPGQYVMLSIKDTGIGMDQMTLERVFEPFYSTKPTGQGTGLGLAMAYGIVKNHNGSILCESRKGSGTEFKIYLPAIEGNAGKKEKVIRAEPPKGNGETILVIDDEFVLRKLITQVLTLHNYNVLTSKNGEEGIEVYKTKQDQISLVILDMIMPGMGGKNCMKEILKIDPHANIFIASGYTSNDTRYEIEQNGARGFIRKPYDFMDILRIIREFSTASNP